MRALTLFLLLAASAGCSRRMGEREYAEFLTDAHAYLTARQAALDSAYHLGSYQRYDWDQGTEQIVFSDSGVAKVVADIQFVGSTSTLSGTWLWAWDNPTVDARLRRDVLRVRDYGRRHGIRKLTRAKWPADEVDGWEMTSISAKLLQAEGAYRSPGENGASFLLLRNVRWASRAPGPERAVGTP